MTSRRQLAHQRKAQHDARPHHRDTGFDAGKTLDMSVEDVDEFDAFLGDDENECLRQFLGDHGLDDDDPADQKPPGELH